MKSPRKSPLDRSKFAVGVFFFQKVSVCGFFNMDLYGKGIFIDIAVNSAVDDFIQFGCLWKINFSNMGVYWKRNLRMKLI